MTTIKRKPTRSAAGRRPKSTKPDQDSRAAILKAARSVFARRGFEGATTREVAEVARVNNAMIYYHFKDKVELYRSVLADSFTAFDRIWEHEIFRSPATTREKVKKYVEEFIRFQHRNEELRRIMSMEFAACSKNTKWLADNFFVKSYEKLATLLKEGMRRGELRKLEPSMAIPSLVGMIIHSFIMRPIAEHVTGRKLDLTAERFGNFVTCLFFDGLCLAIDNKKITGNRGHSK
ncbi:MAG: TetR/AcrR family transcriptional regulator [Nitrospirota bacterium]